MHNYCKAYKLKDVRQFSGWTEKVPDGGEPLGEEDLCFIWDDYTVTKGALSGDQHGYIYDDITPEWKDFCHNTLNFEVPEDLRETGQESA